MKIILGKLSKDVNPLGRYYATRVELPSYTESELVLWLKEQFESIAEVVDYVKHGENLVSFFESESDKFIQALNSFCESSWVEYIIFIEENFDERTKYRRPLIFRVSPAGSGKYTEY